MLERSIISNIKYLCNITLYALATTGGGALILSIFGYIVGSADEYFKSLNKHSNNRENTKWLKDQCLREGRQCDHDLFTYDESSIPHLRAIVDMIYGSNSLCGYMSCREYVVSTWNSINMITFITAMVIVGFIFFALAYLLLVLRINNVSLPTTVEYKRTSTTPQLTLTEE